MQSALTAYQMAALRSLAADPAARVEPATLSKLRKLGFAGKHVGRDDAGRQKTTSPVTPEGRALLATAALTGGAS